MNPKDKVAVREGNEDSLLGVSGIDLYVEYVCLCSMLCENLSYSKGNKTVFLWQR